MAAWTAPLHGVATSSLPRSYSRLHCCPLRLGDGHGWSVRPAVTRTRCLTCPACRSGAVAHAPGADRPPARWHSARARGRDGKTDGLPGVSAWWSPLRPSLTVPCRARSEAALRLRRRRLVRRRPKGSTSEARVRTWTSCPRRYSSNNSAVDGRRAHSRARYRQVVEPSASSFQGGDHLGHDPLGLLATEPHIPAQQLPDQQVGRHNQLDVPPLARGGP